MSRVFPGAEEETVGFAWLFALLTGMMYVLAVGQMWKVKQCQRIVLKRIWWANGHPMIVARPGKLKDTRTRVPQMVDCSMKRSGVGIFGGRFRLRETGDPFEDRVQPAWGKDNVVSCAQTCSKTPGEGDQMDRRRRETSGPTLLS